MNLDSLTVNELTQVQTILQSAHDRMETVGFNIMSYEGDPNGRACYIGTVAMAAGQPVYAGAKRKGALAEAFALLDDLGQERLQRLFPKYNQEGQNVPGGTIELYGFACRDRIFSKTKNNYEKAHKLQQEQALCVMREALTEVYNALEAKAVLA